MNDVLQQIEEALEKAAPMKWKVGKASPNGLQNIGTVRGITAQLFSEADAELVVLLVNNARLLVDEMKRRDVFEGGKANENDGI